MENQLLKVLLISGDADSARHLGELLLCAADTVDVTVEPTADAGLSMLATNSFDAVLFDIPAVNTAALFQITLLTTKAPQLPVLVVGPGEDEAFLAEADRMMSSDAASFFGEEFED